MPVFGSRKLPDSILFRKRSYRNQVLRSINADLLASAANVTILKLIPSNSRSMVLPTINRYLNRAPPFCKQGYGTHVSRNSIAPSAIHHLRDIAWRHVARRYMVQTTNHQRDRLS